MDSDRRPVRIRPGQRAQADHRHRARPGPRPDLPGRQGSGRRAHPQNHGRRKARQSRAVDDLLTGWFRAGLRHVLLARRIAACARRGLLARRTPGRHQARGPCLARPVQSGRRHLRRLLRADAARVGYPRHRRRHRSGLGGTGHAEPLGRRTHPLASR